VDNASASVASSRDSEALSPLSRIPFPLFLGPSFPERVRRGGVSDLLSNDPLLEVRAKPGCRLFRGFHKQDTRDRMVEDFNAGSIRDRAEVVGIRGFLRAKDFIPHPNLHLCGVGYPVSLIFRAEPPSYAIVEQQLLDGI